VLSGCHLSFLCLAGARLIYETRPLCLPACSPRHSPRPSIFPLYCASPRVSFVFEINVPPIYVGYPPPLPFLFLFRHLSISSKQVCLCPLRFWVFCSLLQLVFLILLCRDRLFRPPGLYSKVSPLLSAFTCLSLIKVSSHGS
jgi:hypothetical protein